MEGVGVVANGGSYEWFLKRVMDDFDQRVLSIQQVAEESAAGLHLCFFKQV